MPGPPLIAIIPVRNENWILSKNIQTLLQFCDYIILSIDPNDSEFNETTFDQRVIPVYSPSNELSSSQPNRRQYALEKARCLAEQPILIAVDADEIFSCQVLEILRSSLQSTAPGSGYCVNFRELWFSPHLFRNDLKSNWSNRLMPCIWRDDGSNYPIGNRHEARIPTSITNISKLDLDLLHFARVPYIRYWSRIRYYILHEVCALKKNPWKTNFFYSITYDISTMSLSPIPDDWYNHWISSNPDFLDFSDSSNNWFIEESLRYISDLPVSTLIQCDVWDYDWAGHISRYLPEYAHLLPKLDLVNRSIPNRNKNIFNHLRNSNSFPVCSLYFFWLASVRFFASIKVYQIVHRLFLR